MQASISIAHEYVKLGKIGHAAAVYACAARFGEDRANQMSDEVRIVFLLRRAESLAITGNADQR